MLLPTPSRQVLKRVGFPGAMVAEPIVVICGLIINCFQPGEIKLSDLAHFPLPHLKQHLVCQFPRSHPMVPLFLVNASLCPPYSTLIPGCARTVIDCTA